MDDGFGLYRIQPTQGADDAGGDPKDLGRAERSYTYAEAYAATGRFDKAVLEYKQAWTNAIKALR